MSHGYQRLSGEEIIMGKSYPTHVTIPLDEYSEVINMLYKLSIKIMKQKRKLYSNGAIPLEQVEHDICEIINKAQDLMYKEKSK